MEILLRIDDAIDTVTNEYFFHPKDQYERQMLFGKTADVKI